MNSVAAPLISVIMPCYNSGRFISAAIDSILNQTYQHFELVIIDDGSTDNSIEIINRYQSADDRIIFLQNEDNLGIVESLNNGIQHAKGSFIARMDADDISNPQRFERQVSYMINHPDCIVCGSNIILIDESGSILGLRRYFIDNNTIKKRILQKNPFAHPSTMIRKRVLLDNNIQYSNKFRRTEDYHLWIRLFNHGDFANINESLLQYRISNFSIKSNYARAILYDTLRLKFQYLAYANGAALATLLCEMALYLFPGKVIAFLFLAVQKFSAPRFGKRLLTREKSTSPETRNSRHSINC